MTIEPEFSYCVPINIELELECSIDLVRIQCPPDLIQVNQELLQLKIQSNNREYEGLNYKIRVWGNDTLSNALSSIETIMLQVFKPCIEQGFVYDKHAT